MGRMISVFVLGALVATGAFTALNHHFIRTSDGLIVERKSEAGVADTWADTRAWGPVDYLKRPAITKALARHGLGKLFGQTTVEQGKQAIDESLEQSKKALGDGIDRLREAVQ